MDADNEAKAVNKLVDLLNERFKLEEQNYVALSGCYLKYYNSLKNNVSISFKKGKDYYQTDILIFKIECNTNDCLNCKKKKTSCKSNPLVVIEVKNKKYIAHDVIVYSDKAKRHKLFYPNLRYGFVVTNPDKKTKLTYRYFAHSESFDFAYLFNQDDFEGFYSNIIKKEIKAAEKQMELFENSDSDILKGYRTELNLAYKLNTEK